MKRNAGYRYGIVLYVSKLLSRKRDSIIFIVVAKQLIIIKNSFYYLIWVAIPQARSSPHFALSYYSEFGDSPSEVIKNIVLSPNRTLSIAFGEEKIEYLRKILLPFGFLPVLSPHILILAAPDLFINLLGSNPNLHQIYYQYTATITPFLVAAAVQAIRLMYKKIPKLPLWIISFYVIASTLYAFYQYGHVYYAQSKPTTDQKRIGSYPLWCRSNRNQ